MDEKINTLNIKICVTYAYFNPYIHYHMLHLRSQSCTHNENKNKEETLVLRILTKIKMVLKIGNGQSISMQIYIF